MKEHEARKLLYEKVIPDILKLIQGSGLPAQYAKYVSANLEVAIEKCNEALLEETGFKYFPPKN